MKIILLACVFILEACSTTSTQVKQTTKVFNMGSLHGHMLGHPRYDLKVFINAIELYQPDIILTEVRPQHPGSIDGSIDGGIEQALIYAIGEIRDIEVIPIDWFDDNFIIQRDIENKRESKDIHVKNNIEPLFNKYVNKFKSETFEVLNGDSVKELVRSFYDLYEDYGYKISKIRNDKICSNFKKEIKKLPGKKVLTIFGLDHRYALDDCSESIGIQPLKINDWYESGQKAHVDSRIIDLTLKNLEMAKSTLQKRLKNGYYTKAYSKQISGKVKSFNFWMKSVKKLR